MIPLDYDKLHYFSPSAWHVLEGAGEMALNARRCRVTALDLAQALLNTHFTPDLTELLQNCVAYLRDNKSCVSHHDTLRAHSSLVHVIAYCLDHDWFVQVPGLILGLARFVIDSTADQKSRPSWSDEYEELVLSTSKKEPTMPGVSKLQPPDANALQGKTILLRKREDTMVWTKIRVYLSPTRGCFYIEGEELWRASAPGNHPRRAGTRWDNVTEYAILDDDEREKIMAHESITVPPRNNELRSRDDFRRFYEFDAALCDAFVLARTLATGLRSNQIDRTSFALSIAIKLQELGQLPASGFTAAMGDKCSTFQLTPSDRKSVLLYPWLDANCTRWLALSMADAEREATENTLNLANVVQTAERAHANELFYWFSHMNEAHILLRQFNVGSD